MDSLWLNISLVVFFIALGGAFAAAELALVSLRESQLSALEKKGGRGRIVASLARDPNTFLAAVQIGVTISGFFSAAFGATALAPVVAQPLRNIGVDPEIAGVVAVVAMTLTVAYLSLVFGELAPKRLALQRAEGFALAIAPAIAGIATLLKPLIWLVSKSSDGVVRVLGGDPSLRAEHLSNEELLTIVESHEGLGDEQREILSDVLEASQRTLEHVMKPRGDVESLKATMTIAQAKHYVQTRPFSRYPVVTRSLDDCEQFIHVRDLMEAPEDSTVGSLAREIPQLPASMRMFSAISELRAEGKHIAVVRDEYGGADGLVTLEDLIEELIGEVYDEHDPADRDERARKLSRHGQLPGNTSIHRFHTITGVHLPQGPYSTIAGYILATLGAIPAPGDGVTVGSTRLTVEAVENRRITLVAVYRDGTSRG